MVSCFLRRDIVPYLLVGLIAGVLSGMIGIGGGIFIVPALVYLFGYSQHMAQGTTLAMLIPPIGILAALTYYKQGHVNLPVAGLLCLGFVLGGLIGAKFAVGCTEIVLRKTFGACLLTISLYMIFK
ncbi:sulfite exporter TauE/SafE family protein [bacterium]|nr:sulfite exporter TauE/SafE family protein [Candidatus Omnitrophota bacterium]MBU2528984.1 sulfite exporter TauE/SafE family protein [bacterium]MBU3929859.1 sulfite exporter TauE/SafE family protein [bacterium]MBU4123012.1 sulfite exporter TauE/SafE family protein [bacterium]